jgi:hypothetical protein
VCTVLLVHHDGIKSLAVMIRALRDDLQRLFPKVMTKFSTYPWPKGNEPMSRSNPTVAVELYSLPPFQLVQSSMVPSRHDTLSTSQTVFLWRRPSYRTQPENQNYLFFPRNFHLVAVVWLSFARLLVRTY